MQGAIAVIDDMDIVMKRVLKEVASLYHQKAYLTGDVHSMVWNYTNPFLQALHLDKKLLPSAYFSIQVGKVRVKCNTFLHIALD